MTCQSVNYVCGWTKGPLMHQETWWWNDIDDTREEKIMERVESRWWQRTLSGSQG